MKILLLTNNIKWRSIDKRISKLELYLRDRISFLEDDISITRKDIHKGVKIDPWNKHIDGAWFRNNYGLKNKEYDAVGMVITKKDWKRAGGRSNLGGFYIVNSDKQHQFYIICDERSTTKRRGKRLKEFEEYLEHELAGHGLQSKLGFYDVNNSMKYIEGKDNTHFFFYEDTKDNYYKDLEVQVDKLKAKLNSKIQQLKDALAQAMKTKPGVIASGPQPLVERQLELLILICKLMYGYDLRATSFYRDAVEQDRLYAQGRTTLGRIVTNARRGQSLHNYGVAFDLVDRKLGYNIDWKKIWYVWNHVTDLKGTWGGSWVNFVDRPHFQNTLGYSLRDFQTGKVDYNKFK